MKNGRKAEFTQQLTPNHPNLILEHPSSSNCRLENQNFIPKTTP